MYPKILTLTSRFCLASFSIRLAFVSLSYRCRLDVVSLRLAVVSLSSCYRLAVVSLSSRSVSFCLPFPSSVSSCLNFLMFGPLNETSLMEQTTLLAACIVGTIPYGMVCAYNTLCTTIDQHTTTYHMHRYRQTRITTSSRPPRGETTS